MIQWRGIFGLAFQCARKPFFWSLVVVVILELFEGGALVGWGAGETGEVVHAFIVFDARCPQPGFVLIGQAKQDQLALVDAAFYKLIDLAIQFYLAGRRFEFRARISVRHGEGHADRDQLAAVIVLVVQDRLHPSVGPDLRIGQP